MATILSVDDEPDTVEVLRQYLGMEGFEVVTALSAEEALQHLDTAKPDLIITDWLMPNMDGIEFCRAVRARPEMRGIPIILHTGRSPPSAPLLYDRALRKPVELNLLGREIEALLYAGGRDSPLARR